ncbi:MAG TPA: hypothetical protein VLC12_00695 [Terriglobales bacterium]|nr:hypothetical protein [Terriglobales bacterium]
MRLVVAAILAFDVLCPLAQACNKPHPSPENPTIVLGLAGASIMMWRYVRVHLAK